MPVPLPNLDTRQFTDLADEARAAIPRRAPAWTDHNQSDPGITLSELVAAELDVLSYEVNRITDRDRRTALDLLGFAPTPPQPASTVIAFSLRPGAAPRTLPAGLVVDARDPGGGRAAFRLLDTVRIGPAVLRAALVSDGSTFLDRTDQLVAGEPFTALGDDPDPARGSALVLGFDPPPDVGPLALWLALGEPDERDAIERDQGVTARTVHHDARLAWEWFDGTAWLPIADVDDATRALTQDGAVRLGLAAALPPASLGGVGSGLAWLRCRLTAGRHDAAPRLEGIAIHAVAAVQSVPLSTRFRLAAGCVVPAGGEPVVGAEAGLALQIDDEGRITFLAAGEPDLPPVRTLDYLAATAGAEGHLLAEVVVVGRGERVPNQQLALARGSVAAGSVAVWTTRGTFAAPARLAGSFDAAGAHELVAVLDAERGTIMFGDGRRGRTLEAGELVLARCERTLAAAGNLRPRAAGQVTGADDDANNQRLSPATPAAVDADVSIALPWAPFGGSPAEDVVQAAGRASRRLFAHERLLELLPPTGSTLDGLDPLALRDREAPERALNGPDLERIVLGAAGLHVARARAWPELDARHPGFRAAGTATVVVLPSLPAPRPVPTGGLLVAVRNVVEQRRLVGSRILVAGPTYVDVAVHAQLQAVAGQVPAIVTTAARAAVDAFLHPLSGGPDGRGWPFGRDVYRVEILAILDGVPGVDSVLSLELVGPDGQVTCGNVCVPPTALVAAGNHSLETLP